MFHNRRATSIENDALCLTVLHEGGHIAEILDKQTGINPLWIPPWPSIEPSSYDAARHPEYGGGADASLLSGIMGHNLCLDIFGGPSSDEAAAGLPVHGEVSTARFTVEGRGDCYWYYGTAGAEVFEVWADVAARYPLDPTYNAIIGEIASRAP